MNPPTLRPLHATDAAAIASAFAAIGWSKPREQFERYLAEQDAGERHVRVAHRGGEFAGYVTLNWRPHYPPFQTGGVPEIQDLNVLPSFRRRGIGGALLDAAENAAGERTDTVGIGVGLFSDYGAAQRLYVRRGYVPDGRGITYRTRVLAYGDQAMVDDDLVMWFTKALAR